MQGYLFPGVPWPSGQAFSSRVCDSVNLESPAGEMENASDPEQPSALTLKSLFKVFQEEQLITCKA